MVQASNGISLSSGLHSVTGVQLRDQFSCGNDYAPKVFTFSVFFMLRFCFRVSSYRLFLCQQVRKPYTITKQRERWSEEEHKKFLDALKLYGRAWRRIEGMIQYFNLHFLYSQANSLTMIHFLTLFGFYNRTRGNKKCSSD